MKKILILLIKFYQKYISILSYGSCRYYPTCSEYAITQFEFNNIFVAIFFSIKRILSCNQLFKGGFDYVKIDKNYPKRVKFKKIKIKYWLIPQGDKIVVVKNKF